MIAQPVVVMQQSANWTNGLFDCTEDLGFCCLAWFCPCIAFGQLKEMMGEGCCGGCCVMYCAIQFGFGLCVACSNRTTIRSRYNIQGGCCGDCCIHMWCDACAYTQEHLQLMKVPYKQAVAVAMPMMVAAPPTNVVVMQH